MHDHGTIVYRNRWAIAAGGGAIAFLLFWLSIGTGFFWSLVLGIIVFVLLLIVIGLIGADAEAGQGGASGQYVGGAVSTEPERGGSTVPPNVAAGAGAAGGAATSATSPAMTGTPVGEGADAGSDHEAVATSPASARAAASAAQATGGAGHDAGTTADPVPEAPEEPAAAEAPTTAPPAPSGDRPASATATGDPATPVAVTPGEVGTKPATLSAPRDGKADDLKKIKGVGPKLETLCNSLGFWHFDQIAGWSEKEIDWVDAHLEGFKGRVRRDDWVAQASTLASGGETDFSNRVDKGGVN